VRLYYKTFNKTTSSINTTHYGQQKLFKKAEWWQFLEVGDKIIYESYFNQSGRKAIHEVIAIDETGVMVKNDFSDCLVIGKDSLSKFTSLKSFKEKYPEEFI